MRICEQIRSTPVQEGKCLISPQAGCLFRASVVPETQVDVDEAIVRLGPPVACRAPRVAASQV